MCSVMFVILFLYPFAYFVIIIIQAFFETFGFFIGCIATLCIGLLLTPIILPVIISLDGLGPSYDRPVSAHKEQEKQKAAKASHRSMPDSPNYVLYDSHDHDYDNGYDDGYHDGYDDGYHDGYDDGYGYDMDDDDLDDSEGPDDNG